MDVFFLFLLCYAFAAAVKKSCKKKITCPKGQVTFVWF